MTNIVALKPIIKRIIGGKYTRPILTKVLSNGIDLSLTNLETYITLKGTNLPNGLLDLESLGLTNKVSELDASDFPLFPIVDIGSKITVSISNLELLLESASTDETRIYLNSVAWAGTDLVSINGHIMTLISGQVNNDHDTSIMPRTSLKELINLSKKFKIKHVTISVDSEFFKVDNEHFTLMGRLINREYPKYQSVVPVKTSQSMTIDNPVQVRTVKDILNRNKAVRLETDNQVTSLVVDGSEFKQVVGTSDFKGILGFNLKYLEFLTCLDSNLKFNNELSPVRVDRGNITRIAMPLKV